MADLRTRFLEDYAGGLLNVARQEISSTGEVLAQDGFVDNLTFFVEDGRGVKSGLRLGASLAECTDPLTETGVLNVRTADRTYAKIRDLKIFSTAVASAQAALSESVADSFTNLEGAFESLETDVQVYRERGNEAVEGLSQQITSLTTSLTDVQSSLSSNTLEIQSLSLKLSEVESTLSSSGVIKQELTSSVLTPIITAGQSSDLSIDAWNYYAILSVSTDVPSWVSFYISPEARENDLRTEVQGTVPGLITDVVTGTGGLTIVFAPAIIGYGASRGVNIRVRNISQSSNRINVTLRYIKL
jgi:hypothetical protein